MNSDDVWQEQVSNNSLAMTSCKFPAGFSLPECPDLREGSNNSCRSPTTSTNRGGELERCQDQTQRPGVTLQRQERSSPAAQTTVHLMLTGAWWCLSIIDMESSINTNLNITIFDTTNTNFTCSGLHRLRPQRLCLAIWLV